MPHQDSYRENEKYAQFLEGWDEGFYAKYADTLALGESKVQSPKSKVAESGETQIAQIDSKRRESSGGRVLDVGCGVGQVVARLLTAGCDAYGVDVSQPNIDRAKKVTSNCQIYDGRKLPFEDAFFDAAGALNVLEHVDEPEAFIQEIVRVVKPGGRVVLSSPNFFRVVGFRDYHPRMRGIGQKLRNWSRLSEKRRLMRRNPGEARFDRMAPIVKEPFTPDDDAIVATNGFEMRFFLERAGCTVELVECTDRYVAKPVQWVLNATPLRYYMFNAFVVARKN